MTRTNRKEVTGAKKGEHEAVLMQRLKPSKKGKLFWQERCFFS